jgi:hypothetical protein
LSLEQLKKVAIIPDVNKMLDENGESFYISSKENSRLFKIKSF